MVRIARPLGSRAGFSRLASRHLDSRLIRRNYLKGARSRRFIRMKSPRLMHDVAINVPAVERGYNLVVACQGRAARKGACATSLPPLSTCQSLRHRLAPKIPRDLPNC
jgi:hypothetical protein